MKQRRRIEYCSKVQFKSTINSRKFVVGDYSHLFLAPEFLKFRLFYFFHSATRETMSGKHFGQKRKFKRNNNSNQSFKEQNDSLWRNEDSSAKFIQKDSWKFTMYYKCQGIISESEWADFYSHLQDPLPSSFRINLNGGCIANIEAKLQEFMGASQTIDGVEIQPIKFVICLPFHFFLELYPGIQIILHTSSALIEEICGNYPN